MKKLYLTAAVASFILAGCTHMNKEHMMMMDEMKSMKTQMNEMQFQLNSAETAAARAKEMANEAMIKAAHAEKASKKMHHKKMHRMMK